MGVDWKFIILMTSLQLLSAHDIQSMHICRWKGHLYWYINGFAFLGFCIFVFGSGSNVNI